MRCLLNIIKLVIFRTKHYSMDDFNIASLNESKNEWCARLVNILTPCIITGFKSIFSTAVKMCKDNGEMEKHMMTFQNLICRIPEWSDHILETEQSTIITNSKCNYLEELITCVHIIQMKVLSAIRVSSKQKKIDINIPKLSKFIHKVYINAGRKIYTNVYLFKLNDPPLQIQKNARSLELMVQECILNTVRESIPVEELLRAYLSETSEDVVEEYKDEIIEEPVPASEGESVTINEKEDKTVAEDLPLVVTPTPPPPVDVIPPPVLQFNDIDHTVTEDNVTESISAPKTIDRLEEISVMRNNQRKEAENEDEDEDEENAPLKFESDVLTNNDIDLGFEILPTSSLGKPVAVAVADDLDLGEIEILS